MIKKLIPSLLILLTMLTGPVFGYGTDTDTLSKGNPFSFDLLPEIERDLKICDLVKANNVLLNEKVAILGNELVASKKEVKTQKRKRVISNVVRTVIEVGTVIIIIFIVK